MGLGLRKGLWQREGPTTYKELTYSQLTSMPHICCSLGTCDSPKRRASACDAAKSAWLGRGLGLGLGLGLGF